MRGLVDGAEGHLLAAAAAGQQADADFDESGIELCVRLASVGVQGDLACRRRGVMPKGATTTGLSENLMACVMFWN